MKNRNPSSRKRANFIGRLGEFLCRLLLTCMGWRILHHGYRGIRGARAGEIDIIARRRNTLAFIEVKTRKTLEEGLDSISANQQIRIIRGADRFLAANPQYVNSNVRFDVMIVTPWRLPKHYPDAWRP